MASYFGKIECIRGIQDELKGKEIENVHELINKEIELAFFSGEMEFSLEFKKEIPNEVLSFYLGIGFDISNTKHFITEHESVYEYKFSKVHNKERGNYSRRTFNEFYSKMVT